MTGAELVRAAFAAFASGDAGTLRELLDPGVQWFGPDPDAPGCLDREQAMAMLLRRPPGDAVIGIDRVTEAGDRVLVEFTPADPERGDEACVVVTVRGGRIVRLQGHRSRATALADAGLAG